MDKEWLALAHRMADIAGEILRKYWRAPLHIDRKADASPVTQADREVEIALRELIERYCPEHGIVGEEFGTARDEALWQWVLDPIDGTHAFIAGYATFTTLIALVKEGIPVLGIIDQPVTGERWVGIAGQATLLHDRPIATSGISTLADAVIATTSPYYYSEAGNAAFDRIRRACARTIVGGDGYGYAMLASGRIDIFMDMGLKPYDFCALKTVIEGAGGVITDWDGKPLSITSNGNVLAAANGSLHAHALALLKTA